MAYLEPCVVFEYAEPFHIQNPGIFSIRDISKTLSRHAQAYSERCVSFKYWKSCHIQNLVIFTVLAYLVPEAYSESGLFRHIQAYSGIFINNSYNNITFLFQFNLTYFPTKFNKAYVFWLQWRQSLSTESI